MEDCLHRFSWQKILDPEVRPLEAPIKPRRGPEGYWNVARRPPQGLVLPTLGISICVRAVVFGVVISNISS